MCRHKLNGVCDIIFALWLVHDPKTYISGIVGFLLCYIVLVICVNCAKKVKKYKKKLCKGKAKEKKKKSNKKKKKYIILWNIVKNSIIIGLMIFRRDNIF